MTLQNPAGSNDIAIVGMACRLPGADGPEEFWKQICAGEELLVQLSDQELRNAGVSEELISDPDFKKVTGLIDGIGDFDPEFFRIAPGEARLIDPQQRMFLELCWKALEDAGYNADVCDRDIGVFGGGGRHAYLRYLEPQFGERDYLDGSVKGLQVDIGNYGDFLATRVSYKLGLRGPSLNLQTACSTGLVAVHLACQSLAFHECAMALAGAVNVHTPQLNGYIFEEGSICSPTGRLRPFDANADGSVFGNGGGIVVLKRYDDAVRDGDNIIAVIKSTAINNDGSDKMSFTAPSVAGQADVIVRAHRAAGISPKDIGYVETHGTGTILGDPIEIAALTAAFGYADVETVHCALGSVKAQIGHLGPAAGIAGLIKAALVVSHGWIPKCVNFETPNPGINFDKSPFYVPQYPRLWDGFRCAGVSAFGVGGTNAHAIIQQVPAQPERTADVARHPIVISAASEGGLLKSKLSLSEALKAASIRTGDAAFVLATGRRQMAYRSAFVARTSADASLRLGAPNDLDIVYEAKSNLPLTFAFSGMGPQFPNAAADLYAGEAEFRNIVDQCFDILQRRCALDLRPVMFPKRAQAKQARERIKLPEFGQPCLFVIQYAFGKMMLSKGLRPERMIGHSLGEYAAACLAEVFSLDGALRLVAGRGRLMGASEPGAMMAVGLPVSEIQPLLASGLDIAGINSADQTIVSGSRASIDELCSRLDDTDILHTILPTGLAAHSSLMDPILDEFRDLVRTTRLSAPSFAIASTLSGTLDGAADMSSVEYWVEHLRRPVRFLEAVEHCAQSGPTVVIETGPGRVASSLYCQGERGLGSNAITPFIEGEKAPSSIEEVICQVWCRGGKVDWGSVFAGSHPKRVSLPGHQFDRSTFWTSTPASVQHAALPPLPSNEPTYFQVPNWIPADPKIHTKPASIRNVLLIGSGEIATVAPLLREAGYNVEESVEPWASQDIGTREERENEQWKSIDTVVLLAPPTSNKRQSQALDVWNDCAWSVLVKLQELCRVNPNRKIDLFIVTRGRYLLKGRDSSLRPELALLTGLGCVVPQEYPNVVSTEIDFSLKEGIAALSHLLATELFEPPGKSIAYRDNARLEKRHEKLSATLGTPPWRENGRYLITGGLGGVGLALAEEAVRTPNLTLVLTGRTLLPDAEAVNEMRLRGITSPELNRRLDRLERIRSSGADVRLVQADVCDEHEMHELVEAHGPFIGIAHCAGVPSGHLIGGLSKLKAGKVLAPKVEGTQVLWNTAVSAETKWLALCSSVSGVVGGVGHVDYCSANAFMDSFAQLKTTPKCTVVSIAYDMWSEEGMAVREAERSLRDRECDLSFASNVNPIDHPLFTHSGVSSEGWEYRGTMQVDEDWILKEHRYADQHFIPGTAIVELMRAAIVLATGHEQIVLSELDILRPMAVPPHERAEFRIALSAGSTMNVSLSYRLQRDSKWFEVARAIASVAVSVGRDRPILSGVDASAIPMKCCASTITLGPRWSNLKEAYRLDDFTAVVTCTLPEQFLPDLDRFGLHPALLDVALGSFLPVLKPGEFYMPISYERIEVFGRTSRDVVARIIVREPPGPATMCFDVALQDRDGCNVAFFKGYTLRATNSSIAQDIERNFAELRSSSNVTLISSNAGDIKSLKFVPTSRKKLGSDEVEIRSLATGLNFKEVLIASGVLETAENAPGFGLECAGTVSGIGADVTRFAIGDPVMCISSSCFSSYVYADQRLVHPIPAGLTYQQAATIPIAFTTAYDALCNAAALKRGERALIHSIAGGVGLAALQIAKNLGSEVFGTAGSAAKREFVADLGVALTMDSRSLDFERQVLDAGGADVVLNSLSGEFIPAGLRSLRPRGRFIELGRRDILEGNSLPLSLFSTGRTFTSYYPDSLSDKFVTAFSEVTKMLARREITPLPMRVHSVEDVVTAFEFMARAQHIGKVIVGRPGSDKVVESIRGVSEAGSNEIGLALFRRALAHGVPYVIASARPLEQTSESEFLVASHVLQETVTGYKRARVGLGDFLPPIGETESALAQIWAEVLSVEDVGRADRFLDLGGDSLYATQVSARTRSQLGVRLAPTNILGKATLQELAALIDAQLADNRSVA